MKGSIRVSAKTLDDAITEALIQLGVTSDRLEYNVIEKGSAGFLGIGMKQAVIEAWKKEEKTEESEIEDLKEAVKEEISSIMDEPVKKKESKKEKKESSKKIKDKPEKMPKEKKEEDKK